ncbi:Hypothetical protein BCO_0009002 (plasmid) [Borrelia coriaceae ATCC 43381]|uniref:Uncharacterized protein n=1 Tax=Borrelia coriaceae ATCC 43381 TaxID=1408429 RepID=W5SXT0_9SPIR|nr:Hypothetical protein BCO_0009002 [Borrelia coriaceae ATCC 43381]
MRIRVNDKFTIKFKGVLDHAATRKSLERDISKLENLIKPKRTSLGSTKDFIKYNLQEKKRELKNQTKYEKLRDKVEKFRLSETKKLIKQGYTFQKAQREAFKRSTMSSEDLRTLEYKKLKEESKRKGKLTQQNKVGIGIPSIAIGTAIGNIVSHAIKKVSSNTLGFAKEAIKEQAIAKRFNLINSRIFEKNEKASLMSNLHGMKTFEQTKSIEEFLSKAGVIKGTLANLGLDNENNVLKSVELAAKLKASGIASSDACTVTLSSFEVFEANLPPLTNERNAIPPDTSAALATVLFRLVFVPPIANSNGVVSAVAATDIVTVFTF